MWFNYTSTCTGEVTIDTNGSSYDTVLEVYSGTDCPAGTLVGCDNDSGDNGLTSSLTILVNTGDELKIRIGGSPFLGPDPDPGGGANPLCE